MEKNYKYIDLNYLNGISTNIDFHIKIFSMFKKEFSNIEKDFTESLQQKDFRKLAEVAHKVKSNVSVLGMRKQSEDMKKLETDAKANINADSYEQRVNNFLSECRDALREIEEIEEEYRK